MKQIKRILCTFISAAMCLCLFGCNSDDNNGSKEETTEAINETVTEKAIESELNDTFTIDDITIPISSNWEISDESDSVTESEKMYAFVCTEDTGFLMINPSYHSTTQVAEAIMQYRCVDYAGALNNVKEIEVSGVKISVCESEINESVWTNYLFIIGTTLYDIGFNIDQDYSESCFMYTHRNEIIQSIKFSDIETTINNIDDSEVKKSTQKATEKYESEPANNSQSDVSLGMINALSTAKDYLEYSSFSYLGLIDQLEFEKYSHEEAVYGADNCGADWNKQAVETAKSYIEYSGFSYTGLIDQLEFEQFTHDEAVYGADNCGADWNEQAAKTAQSYIEYSSFSRQELIDQLIFEGFTEEQAEYGAKSVGY